MLSQFKIPETFEILYCEPKVRPYEFFGDTAFIVKYSTIEDTIYGITNFYDLLISEVNNYLGLKLTTRLEFSQKGSKETYFLPNENKIVLDHRSYIFMNAPFVNSYFLIRILGHEIGHAVHHHISQETKYNESTKPSVFATENIAQYFELVIGKLCAIFLPKTYEFDFADYKRSVLHDFLVRYKNILKAKELNINEIINLPLLPLGVPLIMDVNFLKEYLFFGYRTFDQLYESIELYLEQNYKKDVNELYWSN